MVTLMILFFVVVYIVLAVLFVKLIKKFTKRKLYKWLAVAFVILLPTWDVVLGTVVYYTACRFVPKVAIYETTEADGIYYEGGYNNYIRFLENKGPQVGSAGTDLEKGYKYVESLVTEKHELRNIEKIPPTIYHCTPFPNESIVLSRYQANMCTSISNVKSNYLVKIEKVKTGISEIRFMKIKNRSTGKLMAEYNEVVIWPQTPFFNWMEWKWWSTKGISCPAISRFYDFQYDVLKLKK
jgi:hypothetical protein